MFGMFAPKVEFNTCVWNPYLKKDIVLLESVQRNFTCYAFICCNIPFNSYNDRLYKLGIKSLEYRRLEFDLILMFKICHNLCDLQFSNYCEYRHNKYNLRQHDFTVQTIHNAKQDRFRHFLNCTAVQIKNTVFKSKNEVLRKRQKTIWS